MQALHQAQLFVLRNPKVVIARAKELARAAGAKVVLRGIAKGSAILPAGAKAEDKRSHPAWWAGWLLSGDLSGK